MEKYHEETIRGDTESLFLFALSLFPSANREILLRECELFTLKKMNDKTNDKSLVIYVAMLVQNIHNQKSLMV
ncbi:MAG: hypothetical protein AABX13_00445 [Nanoarchaeota archaeon]